MLCSRIANNLANCRILATFKAPSLSRSLFTKDSLGVTKYEAHRQMGLQNSLNTAEFKVEFKEQINKSDPSYNIVSDLKRFLHLMDDSPNDIQILHEALILYDVQWSHFITLGYNIDKEFYTVGPTVMRALYHFGLLNQAVKFFEDPELGPLFKQVRSFEILLDWLYDKKRYNQLLRLNESMVQWIQAEDIYPSAAMNSIVMATYLRMGTSETHQLAFQLYQHLEKNEALTIQYRKTIALVAEMKRRENKTEECLDILAPHDDKISDEIRYVKMLAYSDLQRFEEILPLIRMTVDFEVHGRFVPQIPNEMLRTIEDRMVKERTSGYIIEEFQKIYNELDQLKRITHKSLDDVLCSRFPSKSKIHGMAAKKGVIGAYRKNKTI